MQQAGYVEINGETILLLVREKRHSRLLLRRQTGQMGRHMDDEQDYLLEHPDAANQYAMATSVSNCRPPPNTAST